MWVLDFIARTPHETRFGVGLNLNYFLFIFFEFIFPPCVFGLGYPSVGTELKPSLRDSRWAALIGWDERASPHPTPIIHQSILTVSAALTSPGHAVTSLRARLSGLVAHWQRGARLRDACCPPVTNRSSGRWGFCGYELSDPFLGGEENGTDQTRTLFNSRKFQRNRCRNVIGTTSICHTFGIVSSSVSTGFVDGFVRFKFPMLSVSDDSVVNEDIVEIKTSHAICRHK